MKKKDNADKALRRRVLKGTSIVLMFIGVFSAVFIWWLLTAKLSIVAIRGDSMEPTFSHGQSVILKQGKNLEKDMIFIFNKPKAWAYKGSENNVLVKRVLAAPNDTLKYDGKAFYVNGEPKFILEDENFICEAGPTDFEHTLTSKETFVVGDNSSVSLDSRKIFCDGDVKNSFVPYRAMIDYGTIERIL